MCVVGGGGGYQLPSVNCLTTVCFPWPSLLVIKDQ